MHELRSIRLLAAGASLLLAVSACQPGAASPGASSGTGASGPAATATANACGTEPITLNVWGGYRFLQRRGEVRVGLLNISDRDYKLNPLTLYNELPRQRTLVVSLKLDF